jgi:hypothetical protein
MNVEEMNAKAICVTQLKCFKHDLWAFRKSAFQSLNGENQFFKL